MLWMFEDHPCLSETLKQNINDPNNDVFVSVISFWELAIKRSLGKIKTTSSPSALIQSLYQINIGLLQITSSYLAELENLPFLHKDPFDRLIIATALSDSLTVISADQQFKSYPHLQLLWH